MSKEMILTLAWLRKSGSLLLLLFVVGACVEPKGKAKTDCGENQAFNNLTRKCYSTEAPRNTPVGTLTSTTVAEDSGTSSITLSYTDVNSDFADSCEIVSYSSTIDGNGAIPVTCSCVGGVCSAKITPDSNFYGTAEFVYRLTDVDGTGSNRKVSVTVTSVDDKPVPDLISTMNQTIPVYEDIPKVVKLGYTDVESNLATACQINSHSNNFSLTSSCTCDPQFTGLYPGECYVFIVGDTDYFGLGEYLTYQVFANGQWSNAATFIFDITAVNDPPVKPDDQIITIDEGFIGSATDFIVLEGTDIDSPISTASYTLVTTATDFGVGPLNCLTGAATAVDRHCNIELATATGDLNLNEEYRNSWVALSTRGVNTNPTLRFRAKTVGTAGNNIKVEYVNGATAGSETIAVSTASDYTRISVSIESGVTTSYQIADAINDPSSLAYAYVEAVVLGSTAEFTTASQLYINDRFPAHNTLVAASSLEAATPWEAVTLYGGRNIATDYFDYKMTDAQGLAATGGNTRVSFVISGVNDAPTFGSAPIAAASGPEDSPLDFTIEPAENLVDLGDVLYYRLVTDPADFEDLGVLSHCMDLADSDGPADLTCRFTPNENVSIDPATSFVYEVYENYADLLTATHSFTVQIVGVSDAPVLCQYSTFNKAPECGINGCRGDSSPVGAIAPTSHSSERSVYYYENTTSSCWKSTGTTNQDWEKDTNGNIFNVSAIQNEVLELTNIVVDEGGSDPAENNEEVFIRNFSITTISGDADLISASNVTFERAGLSGATAATAANLTASGFQFDANNTDSGLTTSEMTINIIPTAARSGTAQISFEVADDGAYITVAFQVAIGTTSADHLGWKNIMAVGPRMEVNSLSTSQSNYDYLKNVDPEYVCSFSRTKCNGGGECLGETDPTGTVVPDEYNALYMNQVDPTSPTCFRAVAQKTIQDLTYEGKTDRRVVIYYRDTGNVSPVVTVFGEGGEFTPTPAIAVDQEDVVAIVVDLDSGVTTTDQIKAAIEANADSNYLVKVTNNVLSKAQTYTADPTLLSFGGGPVYVLNDILYVGLNSTTTSLEFIGGISLEVMSASNQEVQLRLESGTTESGDLVNLINNHTTVKEFLRAIPLTAAADTVQVAMVKTTLPSASTAATWQSFQTYCAIEESDVLEICRTNKLGASCAGYGAPSSVDVEIIPENYNQPYYDMTEKTCYRSLDTDANGIGEDEDDWEAYRGTSQVTLSWEPFEIEGPGAITGYHIYRKVANPSGSVTIPWDYTTRVNIRNDEPETSFTDNWQNSRIPPIPGTVYFYEVRPIIDDATEATTNESFSKVRVIAPQANKAFVHRWIVNKTICDLMNSDNRTDVDDPASYVNKGPTYNNVCRYKGPGATEVNIDNEDIWVYDIGRDLYVDRYEAGCNFSRNGCTRVDGEPHDGQCIGIGTASGTMIAAQDSIYYNRDNGKCYVNTDGNNQWDDFQNDGLAGKAAIIGYYNSAKLPPLSNVTQAEADTFCGEENFSDLETLNGEFIGVSAAGIGSRRLPNRKEQIAYSQWNDDLLTDTEIENLESGLSLNSSSKCNSAEASGLSSLFEDSSNVDANNKETLPGTSSSLIRSLVTGSDATIACQSRFGIQDAIGNVAEYTVDRLRCISDDDELGMSQCVSIDTSNDDNLNPIIDHLADGSLWQADSSESNIPNGYSNSTRHYALDGQTGPCNESGINGCDSPLGSWIIEQRSYNAHRMSVPMGVPFHSDFNTTTYSSSEMAESLLDIGPSYGMTAAKLHDDEWHFRTDVIYADQQGCGAMTTGGGYKSYTGAGVWNLEMVPCNENPYSYYILEDVMVFKAIHLDYPNVFELVLNSAGTFSQTGTDPDIFTLDIGSASTYAQVFSPLNSATDFDAQCLLDGCNLGSAPGTTVGAWNTIDLEPFTDVEEYDAVSPVNGFRCLYRVDTGDYFEKQLGDP